MLVALFVLVDACQLVRQAEKPKKTPKVYKLFVVLLMLELYSTVVHMIISIKHYLINLTNKICYLVCNGWTLFSAGLSGMAHFDKLFM
jgi:hypothetical protein